jgi:hypothetical protein
VRQLSPHHPLLLLERPHDLDEHVLRGRVELAEAIHAGAGELADLGDAVRQVAHDDVILDRAGLERAGEAPGGDRPGLSVGEGPDRDRALGDRVGERLPRVDELVELQMQRPEVRPDDAPVELLAGQSEVDEIEQRGLQLAAGFTAQVRVDARQMGGCGGGSDGVSCGRSEACILGALRRYRGADGQTRALPQLRHRAHVGTAESPVIRLRGTRSSD